MGPDEITNFLISYFCLVFSLCVHEASHALAAERCGDPTARLLGRVTLNPIKHVDPVGTVVMPLIMFVSNIPYLFGWARPVPFNPRNLRNIRRDPALIALAGPAANVLILVVTVLLLRIAFLVVGIDTLERYYLLNIGVMMIYINLLLTLFNMIPVPPLDGSKLLGAILPGSGQQMLESIGPFGILIAIFISRQYLGGPLAFLFHKVMGLLTWGIPVN